uniref:Glycosyltransferase n=1 Tax=Siphoviridae sp. ctKHH22 TaxID=2825439 RepID=A0A8S5Q158_9CAUD|nr:MAG TPA: glycosyltransferase [Siphoviridae sp. ctKHH22]
METKLAAPDVMFVGLKVLFQEKVIEAILARLK